jgi:hypothetical protein
MPSDWSITPQDSPSIVITSASAESLGCGSLPWNNTTLGSRTWSTANLALYIPFVVNAPVTIVGGGCFNGTVAAGNIDVGVYDDQQDRLVSLGSTAMSGTSAWQIGTFSSALALNPGVYYMAFVCSSNTAQFFAVNTSSAYTPRGVGILTQTSALPLPSPATFAHATTNPNIPLLALTTRSFI